MAADPIADVHAREAAPAAHAGAARRMFDRIAPTYDLVNRLMSAGVDRRWRSMAIESLSGMPSGPILDLCAGTMDLSALLARRYRDRRVLAADFSAAMLDAGRTKAPTVEAIVADACDLPFEDGELAGVVCGFGVRNLADPVAGAREVLRVLRPGGVFVTLELFRPSSLPTRLFHGTYARVVLPAVGAIVAHDRDAYRYLAGSISGFYSREEYERRLTGVGFTRVRGRELTFGIASLVSAERPA